MSGVVQEVRAKFSATAQGLLSSIRQMREGVQEFGNTDDDIRNVNRAMNEFGQEARDAGNTAERGLNDASDVVDRLERNMHSLNGQTERNDSSFRGFGKTILGFAAAYMGFDALVSSVGAVGKAMINGNADMETYKNTLTTVLKSSEKATEMLSWAEQFAASTPFEIPDIVEATTKLETYGLSAKGTLTEIGNMAAITGKPLMQAVEAVADAQTGELERLKEFGITKDMLIKKSAEMGKGEIVNAQGQITDMAGMNEALFALMKDRFDGGMEVASKSAKGLISNIQDALGTMTRELGKPIFDKFKQSLETIAPVMTGVVAMIKGDWQSARDTLTNAFGADAALKIENFVLGIMAKFNEFKQFISTSVVPIFSNIGTVISNLLPIIAPIVSAIGLAFGAIIVTITEVAKYISDIAAKFSEWEGFAPIINGIIAALVAYKLGILATTAAQKIMYAWTNRQMLMTKAWAAVQAFMNSTLLANPIVLIIALLIGLGVALYTAYQKSETFREIVNKAWDGIKAGAEAVFNWFTITLPAWIMSVVQWFTNMGTQISTFFTTFWASVVAIWNSFKDTVISIVMTFVNIVKGYFENFVNNIKYIIEPFVNFFIQSWENLKNMVLGIVGVFTGLLTGDMEAVKNALKLIWQSIKDQIINYVTALKDTALRIWEVLKSGVTNIGNSIKDAAVNAWNSLKSGVINAANALKDGAVNAWNNLKSSVVNMAENIKSSVINGFNSAKESAVNTWNGLVDSVKNGVTNAVNKVREMKDNIISTAKGIDLKQIGKDIVNGLINGLGDMLGSLKKKAKEIADTVKTAIADKLKIHSPSRVMMGFGVNVGEGLKNGIHSMIRSVGKVAGGMANAVTDNMGIGTALDGALNTSATINSLQTFKHVIDLLNVPESIDEESLKNMLLSLFKNPTVKRQIDRVNAENNFAYKRPQGAF